VAGSAGVAGVVAALGSGSGPSRAGTLSPCWPPLGSRMLGVR
jgi:hypothetical protein